MAKKIKIAIDAGHGSNTAGKRTPDGYKEHWINTMCASYFDIACRRCGFETFKSGWDDNDGTDDVDVTILSRQKAIRAAGVDASVSWHANAYGSGWNSAQGVETIMHVTESKRGDSEKMAKLVQAELVKGTEQKNRGVKTGNFGMCNATYMRCDAAVLIEIGFMTNQFEAGLMRKDAFCKEQAEDACRGLCKYYGAEYVPEFASTTSSTSVASNQKPSYTVGRTYTLQVELKVRTGPGTIYAAKKHTELTDAGKKCDADGDGALDAGTRVTCKEVSINGNDVWIRVPSGWIAAIYNKKKYVK